MPKEKFMELVKLMEKLRGKEGCIWDKEQTIQSFAKHLEEEAGEVMHAVQSDDMENLREELGDLLWNIIFTCQIAKEDGLFGIKDVMQDVQEKIVNRHPHVFAGVKVKNRKEVEELYNKIKKEEKSEHKGTQ
jgi:tetrapyrrole methylase family protein / MazG family protein